MWGQVLIDAVVLGSIYALAAVGFAVIYNTTRLFHVAHAAIFVLGAYVYYWTAVKLSLVWPVAVLIAIGAAVGVGVAIDGLVYAPVRRRGGGGAAAVIASLALYIFLVNLITLLFGPTDKAFRSGRLGRPVPVHGLHVTYLHLLIVLTALAAFGGINLLLTRTTAGRSLRAIAGDRDLCELLGLDVRKLSAMAMAIGSGLAVIGGILFAIDVGVTPDSGLNVFLIAAVAVIVGGIGRIWGAALGAYLIGFLTNLSSVLLSGDWSQVVTFGLLVVVLFLRPQGLLGDAKARRV